MEPKVSVIVPVYNTEKYVEECIKSIIAQSMKEIEIIVVNDGTPDNAIKIIEKYSELDNRIFIINKKNGGASSARNMGIEIAKGKYLSFIDSDDYIDKDMLSKLYNEAERNDADIVISNYRKVDDEKRILFESVLLEKSIMKYNKKEIDDLLCNHSSNSMTLFACRNLYLTDLIKKNNINFNERVQIGEDPLFNLYCFYYSNRIIVMKDVFYNYRENPTSTTSIYHENIMDMLDVHYREKLKFYDLSQLSEEFYLDLKINVIKNTMPLCISNYLKSTHHISYVLKEIWKCNFMKDVFNTFDMDLFLNHKLTLKNKIFYCLHYFKCIRILTWIYRQKS